MVLRTHQRTSTVQDVSIGIVPFQFMLVHLRLAAKLLSVAALYLRWYTRYILRAALVSFRIEVESYQLVSQVTRRDFSSRSPVSTPLADRIIQPIILPAWNIRLTIVRRDRSTIAHPETLWCHKQGATSATIARLVSKEEAMNQELTTRTRSRM